MIDDPEIRGRALRVLTNHWDEKRGHTYPHTSTYVHQWLWDSCFAAICWEQLGKHVNALRELDSALSSQFSDGFVPHIRYARPNNKRGPLTDVSSFTQPPIYAHAARVLFERCPPRSDLLARINRALDWLWNRRRTRDNLIFIVHPWESGADDSPRWDSWVAMQRGKDDWRRLRWNRIRWTVFDRQLVKATQFDTQGEAVHSPLFECAPAGFNAIAGHAAAEFAELTADDAWRKRSFQLADAIDDLLWQESEGLWSDAAIVGGGDSVHIPTLDGVLGALVTRDRRKAMRALDQLLDDDRFAAPYGLSYVASNHLSYNPDGYWRGSAWMQMNYLVNLAARRWKRDDVTDSIRAMSRRAIERSRFAEHWNPETGQGRGAVPLTWSALVVAM